MILGDSKGDGKGMGFTVHGLPCQVTKLFPKLYRLGTTDTATRE